MGSFIKVGILLEARVIKMAEKDNIRRNGLTGLLARETLEAEVKSSFTDYILKFDLHCGKRRHYSIIMFDVDYFKAINDLMGYPKGDAVLKGIGKLLKSYEVSKRDFIGILGRFGGEEFLIGLPYTPMKQAKYIADEIRELIANYPFEDIMARKQNLKNFITVSLGVGSMDIRDVIKKLKDSGKEVRQDAESKLNYLLNEANIALDYAKFMGRNRVEVFRKYLLSEMNNLALVCNFYFQHSFKKPLKLENILKNKYLKNNKIVKNKIKKHFTIIRTELDQRDTRTISIFADNLYRYMATGPKQKKKPFINFLKGSLEHT